MTSTLIKIPVASFRRIVTPHDSDGKRTYLAVVHVKDIPEEFEEWRRLNPRDPNLSSGVSKKIRETLEDNPSSFFFKNRGITLMVTRATLDQQTNLVELELTDPAKNGLLDGGHTFRVIREYVSDVPEIELSALNAFVKLEILEGINDLDEAVAIVESRNTSTQVKEHSLEELRQHYEDIKNILQGQPYADRIAYKENELLDDGSKKDIDIRDILSYLICFDVERFDGKKHPIIAYSSSGSVVRYFKDKDNRDRMRRYIPLLPRILELRDMIHLELPEAYNHLGGKFGKLSDVTSKAEMLPFIGKEASHRIPSGFIYPILAAFRSVVNCAGDRCSWKTDPIKLFEDLRDDLALRVGEQAKEFRNPNKLGKDAATWRSCYDSVEKEALRRAL